ncbi:MAG: hypothetical protein Q7S66_05140 [bacterium]|nr:hypothetical protein [bacterium]
MMMDNEMKHDKMHMNCCWKPMISKFLWVLSFLCFVGGFLALWKGGEFWSVSVMTWYWTALVGGVLSMGVKGHHGGCGSMMCKTDMGEK